MPLAMHKFDSADFADYFRLVGNPQVMAMITERALPEDEARAEYAKLLENNGWHPAFGSFKLLDENGAFLGLGKLALESADGSAAELGYMLLPEYWGQGIGSRVAAQLLAVANAQAPRLERLFAIIDPANVASRKILVRHGFVHQAFQDFDGLPGEVLQRAMG
ncbi:GNAT family N-acetyltransferase [Lysobacteraceae bacterium NML95-0200]|nr:GNAT family N-acetyltransferase [Xanthomonadaceae bacterium NML95-0200]